jgi:hypothetical protein
VGVVEEQRQWPPLGASSQHAEGGGAHRKPVRRRTDVQGESGSEGRRLGRGQLVQVVQSRCEDEGQGTEGQVPLGLGACDAHDGHVARPVRDVVEQRRLADARLTDEE